MTKLYYQPESYWFGDCMPYGKDNEFYLYHQRDTRKPCPFGEPFGWNLSTTSDFVHYKDCGVAISCGSDNAQDQFIFAGSVFESHHQPGRYYAVYTGYNRDYPAQGKASQVLMMATSTDLKHWEKTNEKITFVPQPGYDPTDWRDPFVIWDEEEQEYLMILGTRLSGDKHITSGRTVHFTSKDLKNWEFKGDFWAPDLFTMHEMPDLFKMGDYWYLITTEYSDTSRQVYRMSKSLKGPWLAPDDDGFDGRAYYAGRTFCLNGQRVLFGWVPTRENETNSDDLKRDENSDLGQFIWAGTFVAHELYQREDGSLGCRIPDSVWAAFNKRDCIPDLSLKTIDSKKKAILAKNCGDIFSFEADVTFSEDTRAFSVDLLENEETGEAYQFDFKVSENRYVFGKTPNWPWPQCNNMGLERPVQLKAGKTYNVRIIVDDTIATLYVDGVALNTRIYATLGSCIGMSVTQGKIEVTNISIAKGLKEDK